MREIGKGRGGGNTRSHHSVTVRSRLWKMPRGVGRNLRQAEKKGNILANITRCPGNEKRCAECPRLPTTGVARVGITSYYESSEGNESDSLAHGCYWEKF